MRRKTVAQAHDEQAAGLTGRAEPAAKKAKRTAAAAAVNDASTRSMDAVAQATTTLKLKTQQALDGVANEVTAQLAVLKQTNEAVAAKRAELAELHSIQVEADTLEALQAAHAVEQEDFDNEKQDEMAAWQAEREEQELLRSRAQEEYEYGREKKRREDNDAWERNKAARESLHTATMIEREQGVKEREASCKTAELELGELRAYKVEAEQAHAKDKAGAVAAAVNSATKELKAAQALEVALAGNKLQLAEAALKTATERNAELVAANAALAAKVEASMARVEMIATKAIDGAAQAKVTVQQTAAQDGRKG